MSARFWWLQALGWSVYGLLQLAAEPSDAAVAGFPRSLQVLALAILALLGSLALRNAYRRAQAASLGEFRVLLLVALCSLLVAILVDAAFYSGLWALASAKPELSALHTDQPLLARAPLLVLCYFLWSLLYIALSRQQRLRQSALTEASLQLALKDAQLQALLGQLNPHFMFNAINNIRALVLRDPEAARTMLGKFAATLRYQFSQQETALVTVAEELDVVRDYIELVRLQLGPRLRYGEQVDPLALAARVPRFCLQLLVENGIKHGLALTPTPGELHVRVSLPGGALLVEVCNTGALGDPAAGAGTGLKNLEQRLHLAFGRAARFELRQHGDTVVASLHIAEPA